MRPRTLALVDGNNLLVRASYAMKDRELSAVGETGEVVPTAALLAAIRMLSRHVTAHRPDAVVVCWDGGKSAMRQALSASYKAHRPANPLDLANRPFTQFKRFLDLARVQQAEAEGWEGDDMIAALVAGFRMDHERNPGCADYDRLMIISDDHDLLQLVGDGVFQMNLGGDYPQHFWDAPRVLQKHGCTPAQYPLLMALTGDVGDGVEGLRGVGPKKGLARLQKHEFDWLRVLGQVEEDFGPEGVQTVTTALSLVDLRTTPYRELGLVPPPPYSFWPTVARPEDDASGDLREFLAYYQLESVLEMWTGGRLWGCTRADEVAVR